MHIPCTLLLPVALGGLCHGQEQGQLSIAAHDIVSEYDAVSKVRCLMHAQSSVLVTSSCRQSELAMPAFGQLRGWNSALQAQCVPGALKQPAEGKRTEDIGGEGSQAVFPCFNPRLWSLHRSMQALVADGNFQRTIVGYT